VHLTGFSDSYAGESIQIIFLPIAPATRFTFSSCGDVLKFPDRNSETNWRRTSARAAIAVTESPVVSMYSLSNSRRSSSSERELIVGMVFIAGIVITGPMIGN
jgi:hypothetical protein